MVSYPRPTRTLEAVLWREETMVLVCSPNHELAGKAAVSFEALHGQSMVCFEHGLMIRREIDRLLQARHVEVQVAMEFDNIETIKRAIEINAGVSLLPEPSVSREVEAGTLVKVPLTSDELKRPIGIIYRRGKRPQRYRPAVPRIARSSRGRLARRRDRGLRSKPMEKTEMARCGTRPDMPVQNRSRQGLVGR